MKLLLFMFWYFNYTECNLKFNKFIKNWDNYFSIKIYNIYLEIIISNKALNEI